MQSLVNRSFPKSVPVIHPQFYSWSPRVLLTSFRLGFSKTGHSFVNHFRPSECRHSTEISKCLEFSRDSYRQFFLSSITRHIIRVTFLVNKLLLFGTVPFIRSTTSRCYTYSHVLCCAAPFCFELWERSQHLHLEAVHKRIKMVYGEMLCGTFIPKRAINGTQRASVLGHRATEI